MTTKTYLPAFALFLLIGCDNGVNNNGPVILPAPDSLILSAKKYDSANRAADSIAIKVYVDKSGKITANGQPTNLTLLDSLFRQLTINKGSVYYSRDNRQNDPPEESMKVMELIIRHGLPVRFYTDRTFTEAVSFE